MTAESVQYTEYAGSDAHPAVKYVTTIEVKAEGYKMIGYGRDMTYKSYVRDSLTEKGWEVISEEEKNLNRHMTIQNTIGDAVYTLKIDGVGSLDFNGQLVRKVTLSVNDLEARFAVIEKNVLWWI